MAHFAEIDNNNIVTRVLVVPDGQEHRGHDYLANDLHLGGTWIQTSYNAATNGFRKNYAGIGFTFDATRDAFISPKPVVDGVEFVFNEDTCNWDMIGDNSGNSI